MPIPHKIYGDSIFKKKYGEKVEEILNSKKFIDGTKPFSNKLPPADRTREELDKAFRVCDKKPFRLILVEDFEDYKIFIQIPNGKTKCDFIVWYAKFVDGKVTEFEVPTHDELAKWYSELKEKLSKEAGKYMAEAVKGLLIYRMSVDDIVQRYFANLNKNTKLEISKFLSTLKWISLQEDSNYPPPTFLGSKFTFAVYALLEFGFDWSKIRKVINFGSESENYSPTLEEYTLAKEVLYNFGFKENEIKRVLRQPFSPQGGLRNIQPPCGVHPFGSFRGERDSAHPD